MTQKHDGHHTHHYYPNSDPDIVRRLGRIEWALCRLIGKVDDMAFDVSALEQEVAADTDATNAVSTVIDTLIKAIEEQSGNPAKLTAVLNQMKANRDVLVAAALKGTPAEEPPVETPPVA